MKHVFLREDFVLQIQLRFINPLKNLRRLGIKMVTDIFLDWESYQFRTEEIDAVFHGAVWPQVNYITTLFRDTFCFFLWYDFNQHSLHPDMNAYPGLFFYIESSFVSEHFRTLCFASTIT